MAHYDECLVNGNNVEAESSTYVDAPVDVVSLRSRRGTLLHEDHLNEKEDRAEIPKTLEERQVGPHLQNLFEVSVYSKDPRWYCCGRRLGGLGSSCSCAAFLSAAFYRLF